MEGNKRKREIDSDCSRVSLSKRLKVIKEGDVLRADCEEAVQQGQWEVVIRLLNEGLRPGDHVLTRLFIHMTPQLFNTFNFNNLHRNVYVSLLDYAVNSMSRTVVLKVFECAWRKFPERMIVDIIQPKHMSPSLMTDIVKQAAKAGRFLYIWATLSLIPCSRSKTVALTFMLDIVVRCADQYPKVAPALDAWIARCPFDGFRFLPGVYDTVYKSSMAISVQWCLDRSYNSLAFALAICLKDWDMVVNLLTTPQYKSPSSQNFLKCDNIERILLPPFEESRLKFADRCQAAGSTMWAMYFSFPEYNKMRSVDHNRIMSLVHNSDPDSVDYAFRKAATHGEWKLFERMADICTDPNGTVTRIMKNSERVTWCYWRWSSVEKLINQCTNSDLLFELLKTALSVGEPVIVQSLMQKINMNVYAEHLSSAFSSLLSNFEFGPNSVLKIMRLFAKAGVFTRVKFNGERQSGVLHCHLHCPVPSGQGQVLEKVTELLIHSDALTNQTLDAMRRDSDLQEKLMDQVNWQLPDPVSSSDDQSAEARARAADAHSSTRQKSDAECWRDSYTAVMNAAANPGSLQSLARHAVSKAVGCPPDRTAKINMLPLPDKFKLELHHGL